MSERACRSAARWRRRDRSCGSRVNSAFSDGCGCGFAERRRDHRDDGVAEKIGVEPEGTVRSRLGCCVAKSARSASRLSSSRSRSSACSSWWERSQRGVFDVANDGSAERPLRTPSIVRACSRSSTPARPFGVVVAQQIQQAVDHERVVDDVVVAHQRHVATIHETQAPPQMSAEHGGAGERHAPAMRLVEHVEAPHDAIRRRARRGGSARRT